VDSPVDRFWQIRLADIKLSLEANNFDVFVAQNAAEARNIVLNKIIPNVAPGLYDELTNNKKIRVKVILINEDLGL
jgi:type VI protein secretion system component Hcp